MEEQLGEQGFEPENMKFNDFPEEEKQITLKFIDKCILKYIKKYGRATFYNKISDERSQHSASCL